MAWRVSSDPRPVSGSRLFVATAMLTESPLVPKNHVIEICRSDGSRFPSQPSDLSMVKFRTDPAQAQIPGVQYEGAVSLRGSEFSSGRFTRALASRVRSLDAFSSDFVTRFRATMRTRTVGTFGSIIETIPFLPLPRGIMQFLDVSRWCRRKPRARRSEWPHQLSVESFRFLKPHNFFNWMRKFRFAYRLLLGGRDEHTHNLRFGSALPRPLLKLALGVTGKGPPPGHLHSYGALFRFLQNVGFSSIESFWAVPEMRFPEHLVQTSPEAIRQLRNQRIRQGDSRSSALLMGATPAFLVKYFAPGLFFIARRPLG